MTHTHGATGVHGDGAGEDTADVDPVEFWERRYSGAGPVWSGRANATLVDLVRGISPGRSLDLGCGEGGDVLWLAEQGWDAVGIDLSKTAISRAREAAEERGILRARFIAEDLGLWADEPVPTGEGGGRFDLITASFLQSPVVLDRQRILRAAAERVTPGGRLAVIAHAAPPPWSSGHCGAFPSPDGDLEALALDAGEWEVEVAEVRSRAATGPDGTSALLDDSAVLVRRAGGDG